MRDPTTDTLLIHPAAAAMRGALAPRATRDERSRRVRSEIGLDPARAVVMSGHQAAVWHPGILAKLFAIVHAGAASGAQAAWLVVDHDPLQPFRVRVPVVDAAGRLDARVVALAPGEVEPPMRSPARATADAALDAGLAIAGGAGAGLARLRAALESHRHEPNAARQVARATIDLAMDAVGDPRAAPPRLVFASDLARTHAFGELVALMRASPGACVEAYNRAARSVPHARLRALRRDDERGEELPLWTLRDGARVPVFSSDPEPISAERTPAGPAFLPRALTLTLLARLGACDVFVHGTGGGGDGTRPGYDRATELWARDWLGPATPLAPIATVTATLRLPFGGPARDDSRTHAWRAHRALHDPRLLRDEAGARDAATLRAEIDALPRKSPARRAAYARLHERLASYRAAHGDELADLARRAREARAELRHDAVRADRTWAFPLYPPAMLRELSDRVAEAMRDGGAGVSDASTGGVP